MLEKNITATEAVTKSIEGFSKVIAEDGTEKTVVKMDANVYIINGKIQAGSYITIKNTIMDTGLYLKNMQACQNDMQEFAENINTIIAQNGGNSNED